MHRSFIIQHQLTVRHGAKWKGGGGFGPMEWPVCLEKGGQGGHLLFGFLATHLTPRSGNSSGRDIEGLTLHLGCTEE